MEITINAKNYSIRECKEKWIVTTKTGKLTSSIDVPKSICKTESDLKDFIKNNEVIIRTI